MMKKEIVIAALMIGCNGNHDREIEPDDESLIVNALVREFMGQCRGFVGFTRQGATGDETPVVAKVLVDTLKDRLDSSKVKVGLSREVHYELIGKLNRVGNWGKDYKSRIKLDTAYSRWSAEGEIDKVERQLANSIDRKPDSIYCGTLKIMRPAINMAKSKAVVEYESLKIIRFAVFEKDSVWKCTKNLTTSIE